MQVVLHAGAHVTDEDRLVRCMVADAEIFAAHGTIVPKPSQYRILLRDAIAAASEDGVSEEARDLLLAAILEDKESERLVLSNDSFFGTHKMAVKRTLYPAATSRLQVFCEIFERDEIELFFAIRNPATFLPALMEQTNFNTIGDLFRWLDVLEFRWSDLIKRFREELPDLPVTIWCNEDTPLIWAEVIREMAGLDPMVEFSGEFALLSEIMSDEGMKRFEAYMASHPGMTEIQKRRVISAFLDKFARDDAVEEEFEIPDWTDDLINQLTELYDEDIFTISRIPGITLITP